MEFIHNQKLGEYKCGSYNEYILYSDKSSGFIWYAQSNASNLDTTQFQYRFIKANEISMITQDMDGYLFLHLRNEEEIISIGISIGDIGKLLKAIAYATKTP